MSVTLSEVRQSLSIDWLFMNDAADKSGIPRRTLQGKCDRGYFEQYQRQVPWPTKTGHSWQLHKSCPIFLNQEVNK